MAGEQTINRGKELKKKQRFLPMNVGSFFSKKQDCLNFNLYEAQNFTSRKRSKLLGSGCS
jgi:hypothetical protein